MSVSSIGSSSNFYAASPVAAQGALQAQAVGGGVVTSSSLPPVGRMLAWAGGGFVGFKYLLPMVSSMAKSSSPGVLMIGGAILGGAVIGNWLYNKLTGK